MQEYTGNVEAFYKHRVLFAGEPIISVCPKTYNHHSIMLINTGKTSDNFSYILSGYKYKEKRDKLPSVYTKEEVKQIESVISRESAVGKRDYALLLLAS
ncbi:MAG: hypothetical protein LBG96_10150 [Tannerella sp.]|nr:hypothetical protein [Tannerella sp.]